MTNSLLLKMAIYSGLPIENGDLWMIYLLKMTIEIVDYPLKMVDLSIVMLVYQRARGYSQAKIPLKWPLILLEFLHRCPDDKSQEHHV